MNADKTIVSDAKSIFAAAVSGKRKNKAAPLYETLQGHAAKKLANMRVPVKGKMQLAIPRGVLAITGNSPKALGYALRHPAIADRVTSISKIMRTQRIAVEHLGDKLVVPAPVEAPHIHPRSKRPPAPEKLSGRQRRAIARIEAAKAVSAQAA